MTAMALSFRMGTAEPLPVHASACGPVAAAASVNRTQTRRASAIASVRVLDWSGDDPPGERALIERVPFAAIEKHLAGQAGDSFK